MPHFLGKVMHENRPRASLSEVIIGWELKIKFL